MISIEKGKRSVVIQPSPLPLKPCHILLSIKAVRTGFKKLAPGTTLLKPWPFTATGSSSHFINGDNRLYCARFWPCASSAWSLLSPMWPGSDSFFRLSTSEPSWRAIFGFSLNARIFHWSLTNRACACKVAVRAYKLCTTLRHSFWLFCAATSMSVDNFFIVVGSFAGELLSCGFPYSVGVLFSAWCDYFDRTPRLTIAWIIAINTGILSGLGKLPHVVLNHIFTFGAPL